MGSTIKFFWFKKYNISFSSFSLLIVFLFFNFFLPIKAQVTAFSQEENISLEEIIAQMKEVHQPSDDLHFRINLNQFLVETQVIPSGKTLSELMREHQVSPGQLDSLMQASKSVFNLNKIRAGKTLWFLKNKRTKVLDYLIYEINDLDYAVFILKDGKYSALLDRHTVHLEQDIFSAKISKGGSIAQVIQKQFPHPEIAKDFEQNFANIYSWSIDLFRIQPGDFFKIIYTKRIVRDKVVGIERINATYFKHLNRDHYAFYFPFGQSQDFFDENGNSMKRFFLSAPIQYSRISSGFSHQRLHPVQKVVKAHLGTDYAAPKGTPIWTTADGIITEAGYKENNGLYVKVHHNKTYQTQYLHMSRIAPHIRVGARVKQGEVIGYVGSTGLASGPHVCYRFWKNGQQVDPKKERFTAHTPNNVGKDTLFIQLKNLFIERLDALPEPI